VIRCCPHRSSVQQADERCHTERMVTVSTCITLISPIRAVGGAIQPSRARRSPECGPCAKIGDPADTLQWLCTQLCVYLALKESIQFLAPSVSFARIVTGGRQTSASAVPPRHSLQSHLRPDGEINRPDQQMDPSWILPCRSCTEKLLPCHAVGKCWLFPFYTRWR